jgi:chloride channel 7
VVAASAVGAGSPPAESWDGAGANTGGWFYRLTLCGRRDRRKELFPGLRTRKADAFDSLDFDSVLSPVADAALKQKTTRDHRCAAAVRWLLNFIIGVVVALVAVLIIWGVRELTRLKFGAVYRLIDKENAGALPKGVSFLAFWTFNACYAFLACAPVAFVEPAAGSSGIPEVKMILNGVKMPRVTRFKTLICKVFGNIFSVSSGLPAGYEGPMVHVGAAVAAGISQGKSTTLGFDTRWSVYGPYRTDAEKRDFIVCGAGAGVAAAFNAPVGGVLFSYEESASFWHRSLTWRALFCAMIAAYVIDVFLSGLNDNSQWGKLSSPGMMNFGDFSRQNQTSWSIWELPIFALVGILGGLFGAAFNWFNAKITAFRIAKVNHRRGLRIAEVMVIVTVVSIAAFVAPLALGSCLPKHTYDPNNEYALVSFYCRPDEFNDIASFWFAPTEDAIRQLYHLGTSAAQASPYEYHHLAIFFLIYTTLMCFSSGMAVPSGLFIPTLLSGAALGRLTGKVAGHLLPAGSVVDAGTYGLIGSAAMLAGTTRMTISLATILIECTGNYQYGLPLIVVLMSARFVGNIFNHGLYDVQIDLRHWPILEEKVKKSVANELRAYDVMRPSPLVFREMEKVGRVYDTLCKYSHNGFPVIFSEEMVRAQPKLGNLAGYIQRRHLATLLAHRIFLDEIPSLGREGKNGGDSSPATPLQGMGDAGEANVAPGTGIADAVALRTKPASSISGLEWDGMALDADIVSLNRTRSARATASSQSASGAASSSNAAAGRSSTSGSSNGASGSTTSAPSSSAKAIHARASVRFGRKTTGVDANDSSMMDVRLRMPSVSEDHAYAGDHLLGFFGEDADPMANGANRKSINRKKDTQKKGLGAVQGPTSLGLGSAMPAGVSSPVSSKRMSAEALGLTPKSPHGGAWGAGMSGKAARARTPSGLYYYDQFFSAEYKYSGDALLPYDAFEAMYPRYPDVRSIQLSDEERDCWMDLRPYMDPTPVTVHSNCPLQRAFKIFRTIGLRHLLVTNNAFDVVGIITRHDLTIHRLEARLKAVQEERQRENEAAGGSVGGPLGTSKNARETVSSARGNLFFSLNSGPPPSETNPSLASAYAVTDWMGKTPPHPRRQLASSISPASSSSSVLVPPKDVKFVDYEDLVRFTDDPDSDDEGQRAVELSRNPTSQSGSRFRGMGTNATADMDERETGYHSLD